MSDQTNITFQIESFASVYDEAKPLLEKHWEEIALNKDKIPLEPREDMYRTLELNGMLLITTARKEGELVGYCAFFLTMNMHYSTLRVAEADIFFVLPEHRKGLLGYNLLKTAVENVRRVGANYIVMKVKRHFPEVGILLKRLGLKHNEDLYSAYFEEQD